MTEGDVGLAPVYGDFIKQTYLDPIRTVVVVDDEFPTLDTFLAEGEHSKGAAATKKLQKVIEMCRNRDRPWLVDVHDGKNVRTEEEKTATSHLQHSDLLILDYHLDSSRPNDGFKAIEILRQMAINDHFNLVIVYTAGNEHAGGDIEKVVREIVTGLSTIDSRFDFKGPGFAKAEEIIEEWMDDDDEIESKLLDSVDDNVLLRVAQKSDFKWIEVYELPELAETKGLIEENDKGQYWKLFLKWAFHKRQKQLSSKYSDTNLGPLRFNTDDSEVNWIRTERLFITVVSKTNEPSTLPEKLLTALNLWKPHPHRLLMAKMRAELDERGVLAETEVLGNQHLQAGWLEEFLTEDESERAWKINANLENHWESLGGAVRKNLSNFSSSLATHLLKMGKQEAIDTYSPISPNEHREDITAELNRYACSKPVDGTHLITGHVLRITKDQQDEFWVCLSPACDLVPGQKSTGWHGRLGSHLPFLAVELHSCNPQTAVKTAHVGSFLFLDVSGKREVFSFTPMVANAETNPKWEQMFASNLGQFSAEFSLPIRRISGKTGLKASKCDAVVVAQLRYEYALNLLQRLGSNLSRVGLDFLSAS
jgi:hypothetical protein